MSKGWKRYGNVRVTAVAGSIGAILMVWAALFGRDQVSQTDASSQALAVVIEQTPAAAATPAPATTSGATAAATTTPAPAATRQPTRAQIVQPQTRTRGS